MRWGNLFRIRFWWAVIVGPFIVGAVVSMLWVPLGVVAWAFCVVLVAIALLRAPMVCRHCGKRVKIGSTTCHHCGRDASAKVA